MDTPVRMPAAASTLILLQLSLPCAWCSLRPIPSSLSLPYWCSYSPLAWPHSRGLSTIKCPRQRWAFHYLSANSLATKQVLEHLTTGQQQNANESGPANTLTCTHYIYMGRINTTEWIIRLRWSFVLQQFPYNLIYNLSFCRVTEAWCILLLEQVPLKLLTMYLSKCLGESDLLVPAQNDINERSHTKL